MQWPLQESCCTRACKRTQAAQLPQVAGMQGIAAEQALQHGTALPCRTRGRSQSLDRPTINIVGCQLPVALHQMLFSGALRWSCGGGLWGSGAAQGCVRHGRLLGLVGSGSVGFGGHPVACRRASLSRGSFIVHALAQIAQVRRAALASCAGQSSLASTGTGQSHVCSVCCREAVAPMHASTLQHHISPRWQICRALQPSKPVITAEHAAGGATHRALIVARSISSAASSQSPSTSCWAAGRRGGAAMQVCAGEAGWTATCFSTRVSPLDCSA